MEPWEFDFDWFSGLQKPFFGRRMSQNMREAFQVEGLTLRIRATRGRSMDEWMDGWMNGWMGGWVDGWMGG